MKEVGSVVSKFNFAAIYVESLHKSMQAPSYLPLPSFYRNGNVGTGVDIQGTPVGSVRKLTHSRSNIPRPQIHSCKPLPLLSFRFA